MLSPLMSMETIPPTSELMSPVHSFPNRFLSTDFQTDEELNAQGFCSIRSFCIYLHAC
ncbi:hypothetical protein Hanom_Chr02g00142201 [Helianthus anomalus]